MYPGLYFEGQVDMRGLRNDFPSTSIRTRTLLPRDDTARALQSHEALQDDPVLALAQREQRQPVHKLTCVKYAYDMYHGM